MTFKKDKKNSTDVFPQGNRLLDRVHDQMKVHLNDRYCCLYVHCVNYYRVLIEEVSSTIIVIDCLVIYVYMCIYVQCVCVCVCVIDHLYLTKLLLGILLSI